MASNRFYTNLTHSQSIVVTLHDEGSSVHLKNVGNNNVVVASTGNVSVHKPMDTVEFRWTLNADLDGRYLEYRVKWYELSSDTWEHGPWQPVMTEFAASQGKTDVIYKLEAVDGTGQGSVEIPHEGKAGG